jgi:hypothetical protein
MTFFSTIIIQIKGSDMIIFQTGKYRDEFDAMQEMQNAPSNDIGGGFQGGGTYLPPVGSGFSQGGDYPQNGGLPQGGGNFQGDGSYLPPVPVGSSGNNQGCGCFYQGCGCFSGGGGFPHGVCFSQGSGGNPQGGSNPQGGGMPIAAMKETTRIKIKNISPCKSDKKKVSDSNY